MAFNPDAYSRLSHSTVNGLAFIVQAAADSENAAAIEFVATAIANGLEYQARWQQTGGKLSPEESFNVPPYLPEI